SIVNAWNINGNSNAADNVNFLGTTNPVALNFRVNNTRSGRIDLQGNSIFGYQAGASLNTGISLNNTLIGSAAGSSITVGSSNVAVGTQALQNAGIGFNNTAVGYRAGGSFVVGSNNNTLVGYNADITNAGISHATAIGSGAT